MADDLFEFQAVPKFIDFHNDENEDLHEKSAFFKGDVVLQATPHIKARKEAVLQATSNITDQNVDITEDVAPVQDVAPSQSVAPNSAPAALKSSSNLALFNPSANRVAEKVRRRSQQIQAQPEEPPKELKVARSRTRSSIPKLRSSSIQRVPPAAAKENVQPPKEQPVAFNRLLRSYKRPSGTTPIKPLTQPNPFPFHRSTSRCRDTKSDIDPRIRASVDRLSTPRKPRESVLSKQSANNVADVGVKASSNLALFNPSANRVAEKVRRRSQQIKAQPEETPKESNIGRSRTRTAISSIPKLRSSSIQRVPPPASKENVTKEKIQPNKQQPTEFKRILRSHKPPTGATPIKPQPNPLPFHRSSSRCRDAKSEMDPRIRASVDRLSAPRKTRESVRLLKK